MLAQPTVAPLLSASRSAAASIVRAIGWSPTRVPSRPVETRSTTPHSQIAFASSPVRWASWRARSRRSPSSGSSRMMMPRSYSAAARRPSGSTSLKAVGGLERVPLMNVTVHEHRALVAMGIAAPLCADQCVLDGAFAARPVELLPHRGNELGERSGFGGSGRQTAAGRGMPDARGSGDKDLVSALNRQPQLMERPVQPLEQERTLRDVLAKQSRTTFTGCESQDGRLVRRCVTVAWDDPSGKLLRLSSGR